MGAGQPWRAASLGGVVGDWGPLPVGVAAGRVEEECGEGLQVGQWPLLFLCAFSVDVYLVVTGYWNEFGCGVVLWLGLGRARRCKARSCEFMAGFLCVFTLCLLERRVVCALYGCWGSLLPPGILHKGYLGRCRLSDAPCTLASSLAFSFAALALKSFAMLLCAATVHATGMCAS